jgi:hypothetical protein
MLHIYKSNIIYFLSVPVGFSVMFYTYADTLEAMPRYCAFQEATHPGVDRAAVFQREARSKQGLQQYIRVRFLPLSYLITLLYRKRIGGDRLYMYVCI